MIIQYLTVYQNSNSHQLVFDYTSETNNISYPSNNPVWNLEYASDIRFTYIKTTMYWIYRRIWYYMYFYFSNIQINIVKPNYIKLISVTILNYR